LNLLSIIRRTQRSRAATKQHHRNLCRTQIYRLSVAQRGVGRNAREVSPQRSQSSQRRAEVPLYVISVNSVVHLASLPTKKLMA
jgi:hypothetical protein